MDKISLSSGLNSADLLVLLAFLIAGFVVFFLWQRLLGKINRRAPEARISFLSHISLPAVFLLLAIVLRTERVQKALSLSERMSSYVEAAVIFLACLFLIRLVDSWILFRYERRRLPFPLPGVLHGFLLLVIYLLILFAVLRGILGVNITPLLATSAIFTAIIGLAFQGVLSNVLAGISLNLTKSFGRGDWVKIGQHEGVVIDTNWRETLVLDRASNVIVIPNNVAASEMIVNYSRPDRKTALTIPLKVSYSAPPSNVLSQLVEAAQEVPEVLKAPAPQAYILSYDDLGISYLLKYWVTDFARKHTITGDVARRIWYKFGRQGIEIPVTLAEGIKEVARTVRPEEKEKKEQSERERNFRQLLESSLLRYPEGEKAGQLVIPEEEVRVLAELVDRRFYTKGEILFRQGERGETCYIVARGMIRGEVAYEEKGKRFTSEFKVGPGGVCGEMSLFTGLPRTATIFVEEDAELLEIEADDFVDLLSRNPGVGEVIAELVSDRNRKNEEFLRKIKELSSADIEAGTNPRSILERLKNLVLRFRRSE